MASVCLAKLRAQFKIARRRKLFLSKGVVPFGSDPNGTSGWYVWTYVDSRFSMRADQRRRAGAMIFRAAFSF